MKGCWPRAPLNRPGARGKDDSLEDSADLPDPDVIAQEISDDLQTALEQFSAIAAKVKNS